MSARDPYPDVSRFDLDFTRDMAGAYARMRAEGPAVPVPGVNGFPVWLVTRFDEARIALSDPRFGKSFAGVARVLADKVPGAELEPALRANMLSTDPPDHTRLRRLVTKVFTPRRVEDLRPRIEELATGLLDDMAGKAEVDLLQELAVPLPIMVIWELLGVDEGRREDFAAWSRAMIGVDFEKGARAGEQMAEYIPQLIAAKRAEPTDDLLSGLIQASEDEDRLSEDELVAMVFLLLFAGHETSTNLIGNAVHALLSNPAELAALRADPARLTAVLEETLRWNPPVMLTPVRYTTESVRLGDVEIPAGEIVLVSLLSANRDERRFDAPDVFDSDRVAGHLAFGHGIHYCLGASLARMEGEVAVRSLVERFPDLDAAVPLEEIRWNASPMIRGLESLPVRLAAS